MAEKLDSKAGAIAGGLTGIVISIVCAAAGVFVLAYNAFDKKTN